MTLLGVILAVLLAKAIFFSLPTLLIQHDRPAYWDLMAVVLELREKLLTFVRDGRGYYALLAEGLCKRLHLHGLEMLVVVHTQKSS